MDGVPQVPQPPPPRSPQSSSSSRPHGQRYVPAPPSLLTNVAASVRMLEGPATAAPWPSSPLISASALLPRSQSSATAHSRPNQGSMTAYNPQEWRRTGTGGPATSYLPHSATQPRGTANMTGMEAHLPEPPPPYSASSSPAPPVSRSAHTSPYSSSFGHSTSSTSSPPGQDVVVQRSTSYTPRSTVYSPQSGQSPPTSFPPPPSGHRDRSGSRTRGVLNTLSAFASRQRQNEIASPVDPSVYNARQRSGSGLREATPPSALYAVNASDQLQAPPGGRRSVSVGVLGSASASRSSSRDGLASNWQQGMPLPPPPPGYPPGSRSQSVDRISNQERDALSQCIQAPTPVRFLGTRLGPVPPTPADWVEDDRSRESGDDAATGHTQRGPLHLETVTQAEQLSRKHFPDQSILSAVEPGNAQTPSNNIDGTFGRLPAPRDSSTKGIRERRMESRAKMGEPQTAIEPSIINPWAEAKPANLMLPSGNNGVIGRMRHASKSSTSPRNVVLAHTPSSAGEAFASASSATSDMEERQRLLSGKSTAVMTPPFSPESEETQRKHVSGQSRSGLSAAALPTPPHRDSAVLGSGRSLVDERPIATPVESRTPLSGSIRGRKAPDVSDSKTLSDFFQASLDRYRVFVEKEDTASDDRERLELFSQFFVSESRLRRDRYSTAFSAMGSDVLDLTRDLWRTNEPGKRTQTATPRLDTRTISANRTVPPPQDPTSASSQGSLPFTPGTEQESPSSTSSVGRTSRDDYKRTNNYKPALSPILSMAQSTVTDEEGSRGRAPSRWWEKSNSGDSFGNGGRKIERTKRESKYMGFSRQNLESLQWEPESSPSYTPGSAGPSNYAHLGPNEYPPEKGGWFDESTPNALSTFQQEPRTPQPQRLDVSRLITLPPPYPRHHPAVNNKHPELSALRQELRSLSDVEEKRDRRTRFEIERVEANFDSGGIAQRRLDTRRQIQSDVSEGKMSFAEAARAEGAFEESETRAYKNLTKANFNLFTKTVFQPLSTLIEERLAIATGSINLLRASLLDSAAAQNPNAMQESGDELPELLEKVTLMKWFFEAREALHKDVFELQSESDELYKQVILAPYLVTSNKDKSIEVESFFATDARDRMLTFAQEALKRFDQFHATVDESVNKGVEAQISAFWDIAPPLLEVVDKVPLDVARLPGFDVQIPPSELEENPSYEQFPMQYLYTLLAHAEKSSYQFIESQTNLFCLLHEVNLGVMGARVRQLQCQREKEAPPTTDVDSRERQRETIEEEMEGIRAQEDKRLTRELKDRVQVVEEQWKSALGSALGNCRQRIGNWLISVGGWDDGLEE